jgi:hypothetical protein
MADSKGRIRKWNSLEEELEALKNNPVEQSLLEDLKSQDPVRVQRLIEELKESAKGEDSDHDA